MEDIAAICEKNNVDVVLIRTPQKDWTYEQHCQMESLASAFGLVFIDYNFLVNEIALEAQDFNDVNHLNANGADKLSAHIGRYLKENYFFETRIDSKLWDEDYKRFLEYDKKRREETGLSFQEK